MSSPNLLHRQYHRPSHPPAHRLTSQPPVSSPAWQLMVSPLHQCIARCPRPHTWPSIGRLHRCVPPTSPVMHPCEPVAPMGIPGTHEVRHQVWPPGACCGPMAFSPCLGSSASSGRWIDLWHSIGRAAPGGVWIPSGKLGNWWYRHRVGRTGRTPVGPYVAFACFCTPARKMVEDDVEVC